MLYQYMYTHSATSKQADVIKQQRHNTSSELNFRFIALDDDGRNVCSAIQTGLSKS